MWIIVWCILRSSVGMAGDGLFRYGHDGQWELRASFIIVGRIDRNHDGTRMRSSKSDLV